MSRYMNPRYASLEAYVPGEQPKGEFIKLNANESPYPPSPGVLEAVRGAEGTALNLYPDAPAARWTPRSRRASAWSRT